MKSIRPALAAAVSVLSLAACSAPQDSADLETRLKEVTATAITGVPAAEVVISSQTTTPASVRWRAEAGGKTYDCDADNMLRLPDCRLAI
jgi:hypothetical protein